MTAVADRAKTILSGLEALTLEGDLLSNVFALPRLRVGNNKVEFAADIGNGSALLMRGPSGYLNLYPETDFSFWSDSGQFLNLLYKDDPELRSAYANITAAAAESMGAENIDRGVSAREFR